MKTILLAVLLTAALLPVPAAEDSPQYVIDTVVGHGIRGDGGLATAADLRAPVAVAVDSLGRIYIADRNSHVVRRVEPGGAITTVAGNGVPDYGGDGGPGPGASLYSPSALALDPDGNLLIAEYWNRRLRALNPAGMIRTVAGNLFGSVQDGVSALAVALVSPTAVAADRAGNIYVVEDTYARVRKIDSAGVIRTIIGVGRNGFGGDGGPAELALLNQPQGIAIDASGNIFVADTWNHRVRKVTPTGIITTVAGDGQRRFAGDGGPAVSASLDVPKGLALDAQRNLYIADSGNARIRKVTPAGAISTVAGGVWFEPIGDGGPATAASLYDPSGLAFDGRGNLYIADTMNRRVRKVTPEGTITTVAGNGDTGSMGDGGRAAEALLFAPRDSTFDARGNLYVADTSNRRVRKITAAGAISTVAGSGGANDPKNPLGLPSALAFDSAGNLYIAEAYTGRLSKLSAGGSLGLLATNSGSAWNPGGMAFDAAGKLYIPDADHHTVSRFDPSSGTFTVVAGTGLPGFCGDGGPPAAACLNRPADVAFDKTGNLYIADSSNQRIDSILHSPAGDDIV